MKINKIIIIAAMSCIYGILNAYEAADTTGQWANVPSADLPAWQVTGAVSKISGDELKDSYISMWPIPCLDVFLA